MRLRYLGVILGLAACGEGDPAGPDAEVGLRIVSTPATTDTIEARPVQGLVIELRSPTGDLVPGAAIRITSLPADDDIAVPRVFIAPEGDIAFRTFLSATTNNRGRAVVLVGFGQRAGAGQIEVTAPEFGLADTASFTVRPGAAAGIQIAPRDSTIATGKSFTFRGGVVDRFGNARTEVATFEGAAEPAGAATVTANGRLTAAGNYGRATVIGSFGALRDTVSTFIVPTGTIAAMDGSLGAMVLVDLDGANRRRLNTVSIPSSELDPSWNAEGTELAFTNWEGIGLMQLDGAVSSLYQTRPPVLGIAFWPDFSPNSPYVYFTGADLIEGVFRIWKMRRDGTDLSPISTGTFDARPSVAPDGLSLCYHAVDDQGNVVVRVVRVPTRQRTGRDVPGLYPEWSPRGDLIAFFDGDQSHLKVMRPDGTGVRPLAPERTYSLQQLSWSPNGEWLLVRASFGLELIQVDTGVIVPLGGTGNLTYPVWRPGT